jgi:hypothetical protein
MNARMLVISLLVIGFVAIGHSSGYSQALGSPKLGGKPPAITDFYAVDRVNFGDALRIYIAAEDPDGDMLRIAVSVSQLGHGGYATDWTYLKVGNERSFKGYLQWNTLNSYSTVLWDRTRLTVKVSVFDKRGNESNEVLMPVMFGPFAVSYPSPQAPFDQRDIQRLGHVMIDLHNPYRDSDRRKGARLLPILP